MCCCKSIHINALLLQVWAEKALRNVVWCSKAMSEIPLGKITSADMFSAAGRVKFQSSDPDSIYICKVCVKCLALDDIDPPTMPPAVVENMNPASTTAGAGAAAGHR